MILGNLDNIAVISKLVAITMTKRVLHIIIYLVFPLMVNAQDVKLDDSNVELMIDSLSIGSSYEIIRHSQGCFHNTHDTIKISRMNDGLYISLGNTELSLQGKLLKKYRTFEFELLYGIHNGGCTTVELYILKTNSHMVPLLNDSSCKWDGYDNFVNEMNKCY